MPQAHTSIGTSCGPKTGRSKSTTSVVSGTVVRADSIVGNEFCVLRVVLVVGGPDGPGKRVAVRNVPLSRSCPGQLPAGSVAGLHELAPKSTTSALRPDPSGGKRPIGR
jgi:hypothetical protein